MECWSWFLFYADLSVYKRCHRFADRKRKILDATVEKQKIYRGAPDPLHQEEPALVYRMFNMKENVGQNQDTLFSTGLGNLQNEVLAFNSQKSLKYTWNQFLKWNFTGENTCLSIKWPWRTGKEYHKREFTANHAFPAQAFFSCQPQLQMPDK